MTAAAAFIGFIVNIDVDDVPRAAAFYRAAFLLSTGRTFGKGAIGVELLGSTAPLYLLAKTAGTQPAAGCAPRDYARHWTPVHLDFLVDDIHAAVERVEAAGATRESTVASHPYGLFAQYSDPFGNGFCLIQFVGEGYDAIADKG